MTPPFTTKYAAPEDAPALAAVWRSLYPDRPKTPESYDFDSHHYLSAFEGDVPVGYLELSQSRREGDPEGKYWAYLTLAHAEEGAVTRALYERLEALPDVRSVFTMTHESRVERQSVLKRLGYRERLRSYGAELEVATIDPGAFGDPEARLRRAGVTLHTFAELCSGADYAARLYTLYLKSNRDVPEVGHADTMNRAEFGAHLARRDALPEASQIALHEGNYVGYSELFSGDDKRLRQETTAVLAPYRRQGVALALKLRGLTYAQEHGYERIGTGMASNNEAMVALSTRLGFVPQEAFITFSKDVRRLEPPRTQRS